MVKYEETDLKNGVWSVVCGKLKPGEALSKFRGNHQELGITAMTLYEIKTWNYLILATEPKGQS